MLDRIIFRRWRARNEESMNKQDDVYKTRSRCTSCTEWVIEGREHTCRVTGKTETHTNPAAPKPDPKTKP